MIWEAVLSVASAISIVRNPLNGIILLVLNAYMFVTLYSLYIKLKVESEDVQEVGLTEIKCKATEKD